MERYSPLPELTKRENDILRSILNKQSWMYGGKAKWSFLSRLNDHCVYLVNNNIEHINGFPRGYYYLNSEKGYFWYRSNQGIR